MRRVLLVFAITAGLLALLAAPAFASPKTFYVHPSGGNDTTNIQAAFNAAVKAGPGSTVQLSAGQFYTNNIVVQNFKGYFRGAGQGRTFIDCLRGLDPSLSGATEVGNPGYWLSLFLFEGGNLSVSDMSFDITASSPAEQWNNAGSPADYLGAMVQVCGNASSSFNRVSFTAGSGNDNGYNADEGLLISGIAPLDANDSPTIFESTTGIDSVCDCSFAGHDGMQVNGLTAGRLTVSGNVFVELNQCCLVDDAAAGSAVDISRNQMQASSWADVILDQGWMASGGAGASLPPLPAPHILITDNRMLATGYAAGVQVEDDSFFYNAPDRLHATIADNTINLNNNGNDGGIDGVWAQGIWVLHNRISGVGLAGIYVGCAASVWGLPSAPDSGWKLIGNDVSGVTATGDQFGGVSTAQIWLGPDATHCLVVGGCRPTTVLDQGTNDTLINVTQLPYSSDSASPLMTPARQMSPRGLGAAR
jgi:hypothetical protein